MNQPNNYFSSMRIARPRLYNKTLMVLQFALFISTAARRGSGDAAILKSFLACETITGHAIHEPRVLHFSAFISTAAVHMCIIYMRVQSHLGKSHSNYVQKIF